MRGENKLWVRADRGLGWCVSQARDTRENGAVVASLVRFYVCRAPSITPYPSTESLVYRGSVAKSVVRGALPCPSAPPSRFCDTIVPLIVPVFGRPGRTNRAEYTDTRRTFCGRNFAAKGRLWLRYASSRVSTLTLLSLVSLLSLARKPRSPRSSFFLPVSPDPSSPSGFF